MYQYNVLIIYGPSKNTNDVATLCDRIYDPSTRWWQALLTKIKTIQIPKQTHKMNNERFGFDCFWQTLSTTRTLLFAIAAGWIHLGQVGSTRVTQICKPIRNFANEFRSNKLVIITAMFNSSSEIFLQILKSQLTICNRKLLQYYLKMGSSVSQPCSVSCWQSIMFDQHVA